MTRAKLAALIRYKTRTNSTTFTDSDMLPLVNVFRDEIASLITLKNQMYFAVPATDNLVADQREYAFPTDMLNSMVKLELKFTSTEARKIANPVKEYLGSETESEIVKFYSNDTPYYLVRRKALFILSGTIIAVTAGLRLWYLQYPTDYTELTDTTTDISVDPTTTTPGFPRQFHELLARRVAIEYKLRNVVGLAANVRVAGVEKNSYERDLSLQLDAIARIDLAQEFIGDGLSIQESGNDGFDY